MLNPAQIIEELQKDGYKDIFIWRDTKGTYYSWHKHPHQEIRVMLKGEMIINTKDKQYHLKAGDKVVVPPNEEHEAYVLKDCEYIGGSKI